uniref:NADH dehydrogenase subunit 2 n=1 Tax=Uenoa lobata TaxID=1958741 RepID=UPI0022DCE109|nr:NADH dehydrogenase subunit 2 [Uenoa lobata]UZZ44442.1 NADH dehydrogenase subunit 2 [Uenoa lobata]
MFINFNSIKMLFLFMMILSTLFSISSISLFNMWMGMEINLISFIPLMITQKNNLSSESSMKYFLIQSISSANFLFSSIYLMSYYKWFNKFIPLNMIIIIIINISLLMKMGAAPLHFWFPQIMKNLTWNNCLIISTWQKILPLITYSYLMNQFITLLFSMISAIMGSIMGLNQFSLKLIMTYSSINHLGWMLSSLIISMNIWLIYMLIYTLINFLMMMMFQYTNIQQLKQIFSFKSSNIMLYMIFLNFFSLGGLPPFLGFLPKWLTINLLIMNNFYFITFILIMTSLINLFFYMRLIYSILLMNFYEIKFNKVNLINKNLILFMNFFSMFNLIMISMIFIPF